MMFWDRGDWWFGWIMMVLFMILFWGGLIALVVWAARAWRRPESAEAPAERRSSAIEILEERYAKGEIDRAEFEERRSVLEGRPPPDGS